MNHNGNWATGEQFECTDGFARFFLAMGRRQENGNLAFYRPNDADWQIMDEWDARDPKITEPFEYWLNRGNRKRHKFAQLHLSATYAVIAFLQGRLTVAHLSMARETPGCIDVPSVNLGLENHLATVRILVETPKGRGVMAADSEGKML